MNWILAYWIILYSIIWRYLAVVNTILLYLHSMVTASTIIFSFNNLYVIILSKFSITKPPNAYNATTLRKNSAIFKAITIAVEGLKIGSSIRFFLRDLPDIRQRAFQSAIFRPAYQKASLLPIDQEVALTAMDKYDVSDPSVSTNVGSDVITGGLVRVDEDKKCN